MTMTSTLTMDMTATSVISRLIHLQFDAVVAPALASLWNMKAPDQNDTECSEFKATEQWLRHHVQNNCETIHCSDPFKMNGVSHPYADDMVQFCYDRIDFTELAKAVLESWQVAYST